MECWSFFFFFFFIIKWPRIATAGADVRVDHTVEDLKHFFLECHRVGKDIYGRK